MNGHDQTDHEACHQERPRPPLPGHPDHVDEYEPGSIVRTLVNALPAGSKWPEGSDPRPGPAAVSLYGGVGRKD